MASIFTLRIHNVCGMCVRAFDKSMLVYIHTDVSANKVIRANVKISFAFIERKSHNHIRSYIERTYTLKFR